MINKERIKNLAPEVIFDILGLALTIRLYPKHPVLSGIALGSFALAYIVRGIDFAVWHNKKA
ncbi:hypothetical protein ACN08Y_10145 [Rothia sp. P5764]|uniref:hypothetical protein n=1 Tax=Rothia sp. P5764 TaxID=3402654 RepID=UPI003ABE6B8C